MPAWCAKRTPGYDLPKDARTLLETPRSVPVMSKCGGEYLYFGIEAGVLKNLSKYSKITDQIASIDLLINVFFPFLSYLVNSSGQY
jgi:hypothetical protein